MESRYSFDTIIGNVIAIRKYDSDTCGEFFDCYLNNDCGKYLGEIDNVETEEELENEINQRFC